MLKWIANRSNFIVLVVTLIFILIGSALLALPISQATPIRLIDAIFFAVSAFTGTGLKSVPLTHFSVLGQWIILVLIQCGALGFMSYLLALVTLFKSATDQTIRLASGMYGRLTQRHILHAFYFIIGSTVIIEAIGTLCILLSLTHTPIPQPLFNSFFHTISMFSNSGFAFQQFENIYQQRNSFFLISSISTLMLLGSIGYIILYETIVCFQKKLYQKQVQLPWETYIVWLAIMGLIGISCLLFWLIEHNNSYASLPLASQWLHALADSISSLGTGFLTVPERIVRPATLLLIMGITFIGSAPGSTGNGITILTFIILLATIRSTITKNNQVILHGKRLPPTVIYKMLSIVSICFTWIILATFILLNTEQNLCFIDLLFEVVSAFGTLGLSTIKTGNLSDMGKCIIMITMIFGRIGPLSLIFFLHQTFITNKEYAYGK